MHIDIPYKTATILYVETYSNGDQLIFIDAQCPSAVPGQIVYYVIDDHIVGKGCYSKYDGSGAVDIIWVETGISEPAPPIEQDLPKVIT